MPLLLAALAVMAAACGTRVPDEEFAALQAGSADGTRRSPAGGLERGIAGDVPVDAAGDEADLHTPGAAGAAGGGDGGGGTTGAGAGGSSTGRSAPGASGGDGSTSEPGARAPNTASDVGVTPTEIRVGLIASRSGPLGAEAFMPMYYGANAFFERLNAQGGVHGRTIRLIHCDDAEDPARNQQCSRQLVEEQKVFAFVGNATRAYAGAAYVSEQGVPDVGGQPIGDEYWRYPTLYTIRGSGYPQKGEVGEGGRLYNQTLQFRWVKANVGISRVGVVHYNVPVSRSYADFIVKALEAEGLPSVRYEVNVAFPNFSGVVADMRAKGVDAIWDVMDVTGNQNLCRAMESAAFGVKAKVSTSNAWSRAVGGSYAEICRRSLFAVSESRPNADTQHARVREFRETMTRVYDGRFDAGLHQWALEGWAAAQLFTDAVAAQGADVTRSGVLRWLDAQRDYTAGGLLTPVDWRRIDHQAQKAGRECLVVARWDDARTNFVAATPVPYCQDDVPYVGYAPAA